jgi:hypothetical protein
MTDMNMTNPGSMVHIAALMQRMRYAQQQADKFDRQWNAINDRIAAQHEDVQAMRNRKGMPELTDQQISRDKAASIALTDAFGAQTWWRSQATYLAECVQAEMAYRRMCREEES